MKTITKKIVMLFVLLLGTQEVSYAGTGAQVGRGLGGAAVLGGLGVLGYEGFNFYQAVQKVIEQRTEKGLETDLTNFETVQDVFKAASKNKHVSKEKAALGGALLFGGMISAGLSHRSIQNYKEELRVREVNRVEAHKVLVNDESLLKENEREFFVDPNPTNEAHLKELKAIHAELDKTEGRKSKIDSNKIAFLNTPAIAGGNAPAPETYADLNARIIKHNEDADIQTKMDKITKWQKFYGDNNTVLNKIGLNEVYGILGLKPDNFAAWEKTHAPLLKYLEGHGLAQLTKGEKNVEKQELIEIELNPELENGIHKNIYNAFIEKVKTNNAAFVRAKIEKKKQEMIDAAQDATENPFLPWHELLKSATSKAFVVDQNKYCEPGVVQNLQQEYTQFLQRQVIEKARVLELMKAHDENLTLLGQVLDFNFNENDQHLSMQQLNWMFMPEQQLEKRAEDLASKARQKYDLLMKVHSELVGLDFYGSNINQEFVLTRMKEWYEPEKLGNLDPNLAFKLVLQIADNIQYSVEKPSQESKDAMAVLNDVTKCFAQGHAALIGSAFAVLQKDCNTDKTLGTEAFNEETHERLITSRNIAYMLGANSLFNNINPDLKNRVLASIRFVEPTTAELSAPVGVYYLGLNLAGSEARFGYYKWKWMSFMPNLVKERDANDEAFTLM